MSDPPTAKPSGNLKSDQSPRAALAKAYSLGRIKNEPTLVDREGSLVDQEGSYCPKEVIKWENNLLNESVSPSDVDPHVHDTIEIPPSHDTPHRSINLPLTERFLYFDDKKRRIDFVIVYKDTQRGLENRVTAKIWRETFLRGIQMRGLELEDTSGILRQNQNYKFIKVHTTWNALAQYAEIIAVMMPLCVKKDFNRLSRKHSSGFEMMARRDRDRSGLKRRRNESLDIREFTSPFSYARQDQFVIDDPDTFFSPEQRILITHYIINRSIFATCGVNQGRAVGVEAGHLGGIYGIFPLHSADEVGDAIHFWKLFYDSWAWLARSWIKKKKRQSINKVKCYFGEQIGIFFNWMFFYTMMLIPISISGLITPLVGLVSLYRSESVQDACHLSQEGQFIMCQYLGRYFEDICCYNNLVETIDTFYDNDAAVFHAAFTILWSFAFMKLLKRRTSCLKALWHVKDVQAGENVRPEFYNLKREKRPHPVTDKMEPFISTKERCLRWLCSMAVIFVMIAIAFASVFGTVTLCDFVVGQVSQMYDGYESLYMYMALADNLVGSFLSLAFIMIFKRIYTAISTKLTDFEIHRTDAEWNSSFTLKYVLFCVVLYNTEPMFYLYVKEYHDDGNWSMVELNLLLLVFMVGEPIVTMVADGVTSLFKLYRKRRVRKTPMPDEEVPSWENDYMLEPVPAHVLTEYYADMVIQYGVVTMYSAVFPLAAICAVFRNAYNLRYITYQLSTEWRRPVPERAPKFDDWLTILKAVSLVAIVMNAHVIVRKTQFVPRFMYNVVGGYGVGESYIDFSHPEVNVSRWLLRHTEVKETPPANITACRVPVDEYYRLYVKDVSAGSEYYYLMRVFYDSFIFAMFIVAMLIAYAVPDIPTEENNWLKKQNRLAQSALSQYLARGKSQRESAS